MQYKLFLDPLEVEYIDGKNWKVTKEFDYLDQTIHPGVTIHAPSGFLTDFASIPQLFWNILPPTGQYGKAAVIHDLLYRSGGWGLIGGLLDPPYTREESDQILRAAMLELSVPQWKITTIYNAVRLFGASSWQAKDKPKDAT